MVPHLLGVLLEHGGELLKLVCRGAEALLLGRRAQAAEDLALGEEGQICEALLPRLLKVRLIRQVVVGDELGGLLLHLPRVEKAEETEADEMGVGLEVKMGRRKWSGMAMQGELGWMGRVRTSACAFLMCDTSMTGIWTFSAVLPFFFLPSLAPRTGYLHASCCTHTKL